MQDKLKNALISEQNGKSRRIVGFDLAESIAALMVVTYHLSVCSFMYVRDPRIGTAITTCFRSFLVACVPLFLMINGYLRLSRPLKLKEHTIRLCRLIVLGIIWGIGPMMIQNMLLGRTVSIASFFRELLEYDFYGPVIHLWYLGALVIIYLFLPLIKLAYDKNRCIFTYFLCFTAIFTMGGRFLNQLFTVLQYLSGSALSAENDTNWFSIFNPYYGVRAYPLVYFCLGGMLPELCDKIDSIIPNKERRTGVLVAVLALAAGVHTIWFLFLSKISTVFPCPVWNGYNTVTGLIISVSILLLCLGYNGNHAVADKALRLCAENSFGIYLMHMFLVLPLRIYLPSIVPSLCNQGGNILVAFLILVICVLVSLVVKRVPLLRLLLKP